MGLLRGEASSVVNTKQAEAHVFRENESTPDSESDLLPPSGNDAPTAKAIRAWDKALAQAHTHFCENKGECKGTRALQELLRLPEWRPPQDARQRQGQCLEAIEHELLLRELYYGFRILPLGMEPADLVGFEVANYDSTSEQRGHH